MKEDEIAALKEFLKRQNMALMEVYYSVCPLGWCFPGDNPELIASNVLGRVADLKEDLANTAASLEQERYDVDRLGRDGG